MKLFKKEILRNNIINELDKVAKKYKYTFDASTANIGINEIFNHLDNKDLTLNNSVFVSDDLSYLDFPDNIYFSIMGTETTWITLEAIIRTEVLHIIRKHYFDNTEE